MRARGKGARAGVVWVLAAMAALAVTTAAVLAMVVIPTASRRADRAFGELGDIEHFQVMVRGQSNDERAYLLSGQERFLSEFDSKGAELDRLVARLRRQPDIALDAILSSYRRFLDAHQRVVALARQGRGPEAVALALDGERAERLETERLLEVAHRHLAAATDAGLHRVGREAGAMVGLLLVLAFAPGWGAYALNRSYRRAEQAEAAEAERRRLAAAQRVAGLGSWEHVVATGETTWSDELYRLLGYEPGGVEPTIDAYLDRIHPEDRAPMEALVAGSIPADRRFSVRNRVIRPDGRTVWLEAEGEFALDTDGVPTAVVGTARDVTDQEEAAAAMRQSREQLVAQEAEMRRRAYHDALTGLPNRALLFERLEEALVVAAYGETPRVAVAVFDLDAFKRINDSLGHAIGDHLLVAVARRLVAAAPAGVTVARLGGDEFAVLAVDVDAEAAAVIVDRLLRRLDQPLAVDGRRLSVTASAGVAVAGPATSGAELLRDADVALYAAKDAGRARWALFDPDMRAAVVERLALEGELRAAIDKGELTVHYQPIVATATGAVVKVEALVRWPHPRRGQVFPDRFIPLAEETGLIVPLGLHVLRTACRAMVDLGPEHSHVRVAVNLSARQLDTADLAADVAAVLAETGLPPHRLVLEVTESVLMGRDAVERGVLDELRAMGIGLAIDDFGTGYSSLSRLRLLPVDELKIDKSFIDEVDTEGERAPVVAAVVALAHSLGRSVVAEGVETATQLGVLSGLRCDCIQGYLFSRPLPFDALVALLAAPHELRAVAGGPATVDDGQVQRAVAVAVEGGKGGEGGNVEARLRPLLAELARVTRMDAACLTRVDDRGDEQVFLAHNGTGVGVVEGADVGPLETVRRLVLRSGRRGSPDLTCDFPDSAAVAGLGIRAYAVAPVTTPSGRVVGTLCVAGRGPHPVDNRTLALMDVFAGLVAEALEQAAPGVAGRARRVVVVDDSPGVRRMLAQTLAAAGLEVVAEAADGPGAVAACRLHRPDFVLLDLDLAGVDGLSLLPALRQTAPEAKVVVVSGDGHRRRADAVEAGAVAVVDKETALARVPALLAAL